MPHFNKGVYKKIVEYEAKPTGKFRAPLSKIGIYLPYFPGNRVNFNFSTRALEEGNVGPIEVFCCRNDKIIENAVTMGYEFKKQTINIKGWSISGIDHYIYQIGKNEKDTTVIVDVESSSNDKWMMLIIGAILAGIFSLIVGILLWLLGFIQINPALIAHW